MSEQKKTLRFVPTLLALPVLLLGVGCQSKERKPLDWTIRDPLFAEIQLVDVAVLPPRGVPAEDRVLGTVIRAACREILIQEKLYAVPKDEFVDRKLAERRVPLEQMPGILGSDAVLVVDLKEWDTSDLISKGRIHASGEFTLHGAGRVLWQHRFKDRPLIAPGDVTPSNRAEMEKSMARTLVRQSLATLPRKRAN